MLEKLKTQKKIIKSIATAFRRFKSHYLPFIFSIYLLKSVHVLSPSLWKEENLHIDDNRRFDKRHIFLKAKISKQMWLLSYSKVKMIVALVIVEVFSYKALTAICSSLSGLQKRDQPFLQQKNYW